MPELSSSCHLAARPDALWQALLDIERHTTGLDGLEPVRIISDTPAERSTAWCVVLRGAPMRWQQREEIDATQHRVRFSLIRGDPKQVRGTWRIEPNDTGSRVSIDLQFDFGFARVASVLNAVLVPTLKAAIQEIARRAEHAAIQDATPAGA